jgi:hypothetical protein
MLSDVPDYTPDRRPRKRNDCRIQKSGDPNRCLQCHHGRLEGQSAAPGGKFEETAEIPGKERGLAPLGYRPMIIRVYRWGYPDYSGFYKRHRSGTKNSLIRSPPVKFSVPSTP